MANRWGNNGNSVRLLFLGFQNHWGQWLQPWIKNMLAPWKKSYDKPRQHIKKLRHYFADKGQSSQSYVVFPVVMYRCESFHFCCWRTRHSWILWISQVLLEYAVVTNSPWISLVSDNKGLFLAFFSCAAWVGCSSCLRHANLLAEGKRTMVKSCDGL